MTLTESPKPEPTDCLLHRVAKGDSQAVAECVDRFGGLLWTLARRFVGNAADAEDAVQEAFVAIWKNAGRYDPSVASETTFVAMIARRRFIDRKRRESRRVEADSVSVEEPLIEAPEDRVPAIEVSDEAARVSAAVQTLRPDQQKVLQLAVCHGWSHQLIADRLGLPLGTVKTNVRRGLIRVRELLEAEDKAAKESQA